MGENTGYLGLGANLGDKVGNLRAAARMIDESPHCSVKAGSSIYMTRPVGVESQPEFANAVIEITTSLEPEALLGVCRRIEKKIGRKRTIRWGPRVIDIDLLIYEGATSRGEELTLPHPRMMERAFVLIPLAEIASDLVLGEGITVGKAASRVDTAGVRRTEEKVWG